MTHPAEEYEAAKIDARRKYQEEIAEAAQRRDRAERAAAEAFDEATRPQRAIYDAEIEKINDAFQEDTAPAKARFDEAWQTLMRRHAKRLDRDYPWVPEEAS